MYMNPEQTLGGTSRLLGLIERIYAAALEPGLWPAVLEEVAEAIHGESTTIFVPLPETPLVSMARTDPFALDSYVNHYAAINVLSEACDEIFADGEVRYAHRALPDDVLERTEFYNDFFKPHNMHYSMGIKIRFDSQLPATYLSCQRPRDSGPFSELEGVVYETLRPHLQRALSLHLKMTEMRSRQLGLETAVDAFHHAVLGLNREGRVVFASREAEVLLRSGDGIRVVQGELTATDVRQNPLFRTAITEAVRGPAAVPLVNGSIRLSRRSGPPLQVTVVPHKIQLPGREALVALVFLGDPQRSVPSRAALLRSMYGLSPTEVRVADLFADGLTIEQIADRIHVTAGTARFHIKKIFAKTGSRRQSELMKLMLTLPDV